MNDLCIQFGYFYRINLLNDKYKDIDHVTINKGRILNWVKPTDTLLWFYWKKYE